MTTPEKIRFQCPRCGKRVSVPAEHAGKKGKCPGCEEVLRIPAVSAPSQPEAVMHGRRAKRAASESEMTRLRDAAFRGEATLVEALLLGDFDVNTPLPNGDRLIVSVVGMGDARLIITRLLVEHGADVNSQIGGGTLLRWISQDTFCDNKATIEYLKSKGAVARSADRKAPESRFEGDSKKGSDGDAGTQGTKQPTKMELGEGIMILRFPQASLTQHRNHVELIREVNNKGAFPALRVYSLVPKSSMTDSSRLIVLTGSMAEAQKVSNVYYTPEAESYVNRKLNGDWAAINADSTSDNVPMPGCRVDIQSFQQRLDQVRQGDYAIEQIV